MFSMNCPSIRKPSANERSKDIGMGKWLKSPKELVFEVRDRVAYIMLNRPEKRNASSINLHREFVATCLEGGGRSERGAGRGLQATHKRIVNVGLELMG